MALCQWKGRGLKFNLWVYIPLQFLNRFRGFRSKQGLHIQNRCCYSFTPICIRMILNHKIQQICSFLFYWWICLLSKNTLIYRSNYTSICFCVSQTVSCSGFICTSILISPSVNNTISFIWSWTNIKANLYLHQHFP